ncbi:MAG TPA: glycosyltransferase, partial [Gaiellaceae bacterium]|nr:glycosyltransferase [Gaiellaceae bacterium]
LARGEDSMAFAADELGVEVTELLALHRELSPMYDAVSVKRLVTEIKRVRPHIVHTHTAKAGAVGRMAALLSGDAKPPVVVHTFHGHVLRGYFDPARTEFFRETEKFLAKHTTRLIAVGPEVRDDLVELGVAPREKFSVIRLGIDLEDRVTGDGPELRRQFGIPPNRFVVGWVGRMTGIKRVPDVLAAFARLVELGVDAQLVLVGDGPERAALERRARDLGIQRRTLFAGYQRDIGPYYDLFDAFLLPSGNEGTPVVAIESLAAQIPIVATRVGGLPDVVRDGVDGFLTKVGDIEALGGHLAALANDPELRARMGAAAREHVVPRYRVSRLVDDIDGLYRELLADAGVSLPRAA